MTSIDGMDPDHGSGEAWFNPALQVTIKLEGPVEFDALKFQAALPLELQSVANLAPFPRRCFVLRLLVGLPSELCARLVNLEIAQVKKTTTIALSELPGTQTPCAIDG